MDATRSTAVYADQLLRVVLPWWVEHALDDVNGGVFTCFSNAGALLSREKYTWSQGRWAWVCARLADASRRGAVRADAPEWADRSRATAAFLRANAYLSDGITEFRTTAEGVAIGTLGDGARASSVLADLFAALGFAAASSLDDTPAQDRQSWLAVAEEILHNAEVRLLAGTAPSEPYPAPPGYVAGGTLMLLMHVGTEIYRVSRSSASRRTVVDAVNRLLDGRSPMWTEHGWWDLMPVDTANADTLLARHRNPGHLLEMLWMIEDTADVIPAVKDVLPEWLPELAVRALELGWDKECQGIFRYVDRDGDAPAGRLLGNDRYERLVMETWDTKLWWVHVEALHATWQLSARYDRPDLWEWHRRVAEYTLRTFPDPGGQEWIQIRDRKGEPLDKVVALPLKDPFHIPRALLLMIGGGHSRVT